MNEQECSRSVPIRNVPLHRKDFGGLGEQSEDLHVWWIQIHYEVYWGGVRVCVSVAVHRNGCFSGVVQQAVVHLVEYSNQARVGFFNGPQ